MSFLLSSVCFFSEKEEGICIIDSKKNSARAVAKRRRKTDVEKGVVLPFWRQVASVYPQADLPTLKASQQQMHTPGEKRKAYETPSFMGHMVTATKAPAAPDGRMHEAPPPPPSGMTKTLFLPANNSFL